MSANAVDWPTHLFPFAPLARSFTEELGDNRVRFRPERNGRPLMRPNNSARVDSLTCEMIFTHEQYEEFLRWYTVDLANGSLPFKAIYPVTQKETTFCFGDNVPQAASIGVKRIVSFVFDVLPTYDYGPAP